MLDGVLLVERVVDVQNRAAWVAPDVLDAFGLQCLTSTSAPMSSCVELPAPEDAAAAEAISALEISMINLCLFRERNTLGAPCQPL
jgi:hypothetical protein